MEVTDLIRKDIPESRDKLEGNREGYSFYAYLSRMRYIARWGLMRNSCPENIQEHSHMVAVLAHALALIAREVYGNKTISPETCATAALFHDAGEIITGDMPTPVKYYNTEIKDAYKEIEVNAAKNLLSRLPEDMALEYEKYLLPKEDASVMRLIKAADKISALIKCIEEEKTGNREFNHAKESTFKAIRELECKEAEIFCEEFVPEYEKTLDELN